MWKGSPPNTKKNGNPSGRFQVHDLAVRFFVALVRRFRRAQAMLPRNPRVSKHSRCVALEDSLGVRFRSFDKRMKLANCIVPCRVVSISNMLDRALAANVFNVFNVCVELVASWKSPPKMNQK